MTMTTIRQFLQTTRAALTNGRGLGMFAGRYALLLASLYGFIATREATVWQVTVTLLHGRFARRDKAVKRCEQQSVKRGENAQRAVVCYGCPRCLEKLSDGSHSHAFPGTAACASS